VRLARTASGNLLVSDYLGATVIRLDPLSLEPVGGFRIQGHPVGLAAAGGRIFVTDASRRVVAVFTPSGKWRSEFGGGLLRDPVDLEVDQARELVFVADGAGGAVKVFDFQGRPHSSLGNLRHPTGLAVDSALQEVLVSDYGDLTQGEYASLKILDYQGNLVASISGKGNCGMLGCTGGFSRPQGVALDDRGRIYLADALLGQVLVFDRTTLRLVGRLGSFGEGPGQLLLPLDVLAMPGGEIVVTSYKTARLERFWPGGLP
jgi:DNA-binding beta-propeller fold protein YncE